MSNAHVILFLELSVKEGREDDVRALAHEMAESSQANEAGTLDYEIFVSDDGRRVHAIERYADAGAAIAHLGTFGERWMGRFFDALIPERTFVYGAPDDAVRGALAPLAPTYMRDLAGFSRHAALVS